ncbi:MAG: chemotaxis protein CheD [Chloroflexi bacterium]|nr:chemotaxis protein CheD [Chloroflexota bacterium]
MSLASLSSACAGGATPGANAQAATLAGNSPASVIQAGIAQAKTIAVGLGDLFVSTTTDLVAYSLGSCVGICFWDPLTKAAAMAHVVLPVASAGAVPTPGKFADTAVPALLEALKRQGADRARVRCKIAGGAAVLAIGGGGALPNIGQRNVDAVKAALAKASIRILGEQTGGNQGRTVRLEPTTGRVLVRTVRGTEVEL